MKKLIATLLILVSFSSNSHGDDGGATYLDVGAPAPFSGFLITPQKANKVRLMDLTLQQETKLNELLTKENNLYVERMKIKDEQIDLLSKRVVEEKDSAVWSKVGFFLIGSVLTGLVAVGVSRLK